jgi:trimeric autotransporter adhesin
MQSGTCTLRMATAGYGRCTLLPASLPRWRATAQRATRATADQLQALSCNGLGTLLWMQQETFTSADNPYRVRKVDAATGIISTVAGNGTADYTGDGGPAVSASLFEPRGVAVDTVGNLYIADTNNFRIRKVDTATGVITTVAGDGIGGYSGDGGPAISSQLNHPTGVVVDMAGTTLYIADSNNNRVRKVNVVTGTISTVAGNGNNGYAGDGGPATSAELYTPNAVVVDVAGNLYIADWGNNRVRKVAGP